MLRALFLASCATLALSASAATPLVPATIARAEVQRALGGLDAADLQALIDTRLVLFRVATVSTTGDVTTVTTHAADATAGRTAFALTGLGETQATAISPSPLPAGSDTVLEVSGDGGVFWTPVSASR